MKLSSTLPALLAASIATAVVLQGSSVGAFTIASAGLDLDQRHFRVFNNFSTPTANDNTTADPNWPGHSGATLAIWKGVAEWGSRLHGVGDGDPHQPGDLGSGGANFDSIFLGEATSIGSTNDNTFSEIPGSSGGVLAFIETPASDGWRIRFYGAHAWQDGPGVTMGPGEVDLQGMACRMYGSALGLGSSVVTGATMSNSVTSLVDLRSIELDDQAGVQAIYGVATLNKPVVNGFTITGNQIELHGENFATTGNTVWFTSATPGATVRVTGVPSIGTRLTIPLPAGAGSGDVLVQAPGTAFDRLSNAWPLDLSGANNCMTPQVFCNSLPNSTGQVCTLSTSGTPSILGSNDLVLVAAGAPASRPGLFFFGPAQTAVPFGNGVRCAGGPLTRLSVLFTDAAGTASQALDLQTAPFQSATLSTSIGDALHFQFWFRDPAAGGAGFNTSDGIRVEVCP